MALTIRHLVAAPASGIERAARRVLFEHEDGAVREVMARELSDLGYEVRTCGGPADGVGCPVLQQSSCPAVEGADVVVTGLLHGSRGRFIARRIRRHHPEVDLIAEATDWAAEQIDVPVAQRRLYPLRSETLSDMMGHRSRGDRRRAAQPCPSTCEITSAAL